MTNNKLLIVSPQQGFGNRLRALNSAILLAQQTGRRLAHCWMATDPVEYAADFINRLRIFGFEHFFEFTESLPPVTPTVSIDEVYSEWMPGDYWYEMQSSGQKLLRVSANQRHFTPAQEIIGSSAEVILLETSLRIFPTAFNGITRDYPEPCDCHLIHAGYSKLVPRLEYRDILASMEPADIGIWIRAGDLQKYFSPAAQCAEKIKDWIRALRTEGSRVAIFSNDINLVDYYHSELNFSRLPGQFSRALCELPQHKRAVLEFFFLATKCSVIYGTPGSSFAQEAALFGAKEYREIPA